MLIVVVKITKGGEDPGLSVYVRSATASDSRSRIRIVEALKARSCLPPELPAGKRGGRHHDSVYPSFASPPCPTGVELRVEVYRINSSVDASALCRGVWRLGGDPIAAGCGARGRPASSPAWSSRDQRRIWRRDGRGERRRGERGRNGGRHPARHGPRRCEPPSRSEEHTSELQSPCNTVCRLLLE